MSVSHVVEIMEQAENRSRCLETSLVGMQQIARILNELRERSISLEDALDDIQDYADE